MATEGCDGVRACPELTSLIENIRTLTNNVDKLGMQVSKIAEEMHTHDIHACNIEEAMEKMKECNDTATLSLVQSQTRTQSQLEKLVILVGERQKADAEFYQRYIRDDQSYDRRIGRQAADVNAWVIKKKWVYVGSALSAITTILILIAEYYFGG